MRQRVLFLSLVVLALVGVWILQPGAQQQLSPLAMAMPAVETITAGATVSVDGCGTLKRITAAGAVATSTTNTFTAPSAANAGCVMTVCNVGAQTITLDNNANFKSIAGADIVMTADDCTTVASDGTVWRSATGLVAN